MQNNVKELKNSRTSSSVGLLHPHPHPSKDRRGTYRSVCGSCVAQPACSTVSCPPPCAHLRCVERSADRALCFLPSLCLFSGLRAIRPSPFPCSSLPGLIFSPWKWSRAVDGLVCCWSSALLICCQTSSRCLSAVVVKAGSWRNLALFSRRADAAHSLLRVMLPKKKKIDRFL